MPRPAIVAQSAAPAAADDPASEALALLREMRDDLHALRVAAERPRGGALTQADRAALEILLPAIGEGVGNYAFTSRELLEHAATADPELRAQIEWALGPLDGNTARRLGRLLLRAEGFGLAGRRISRAGDCRDGALWTCEQVRKSQKGAKARCPLRRTAPPMPNDPSRDRAARSQRGKRMERLGDLTQAMKNQSARYTAGRFLQAHAIGKGNISNALGFAEEQRQWLDRAQIVDALKSAVSPIATGDFPGALTPVAESFLAAMRDASIPLRLQGLRRVPMLTRLYVNVQGVIAAQVAEGQPIPVLQGDWTATTLEPRKFAGLTVQTDELLRLLSPTAALAIVDDLARATAEAENDAFLNADTPGSVLYGQTGLTAAGSSLANADSDLRLLIGAVRGASDPNAAFVMSKTTATFLGTLRGTGGAPAYPNIGPSGGELLGLQVLISSVAEDADSPTTKIIALLSPSEILWADEGRVVLTTSKNASLQMSDTPSASATTAVSMWQSNSTATRAIRESSWYARAGAAAYLRVPY